MGSLCQSIFLSNRIEKKVYNRSIPHFHQNDDSGMARGFVENSYFEGLNAEEFFFHHMAGREGLRSDGKENIAVTNASALAVRRGATGC